MKRFSFKWWLVAIVGWSVFIAAIIVVIGLTIAFPPSIIVLIGALMVGWDASKKYRVKQKNGEKPKNGG